MLVNVTQFQFSHIGAPNSYRRTLLWRKSLRDCCGFQQPLFAIRTRGHVCVFVCVCMRVKANIFPAFFNFPQFTNSQTGTLLFSARLFFVVSDGGTLCESLRRHHCRHLCFVAVVLVVDVVGERIKCGYFVTFKPFLYS